MFKRISNLFQAFINAFVSGAERANPKMMLEQEKENLRKQIANYNQGLAAHAGLCERLMTQVKKDEALEKDLRAKTTANLRAGNAITPGNSPCNCKPHPRVWKKIARNWKKPRRLTANSSRRATCRFRAPRRKSRI